MARRRKLKSKAPRELNLAIRNARDALDELETAARAASGLTLEHHGYQAGLRDGAALIEQRERQLAMAQHDLAMQAQRIRQLQARQGDGDGYQRGYQTGYAAGRAAAPAAAGAVNENQIRERMKSDMLERCRVIAESNPQMAAGVNAVRHMIKKL